MAEQLKCRVCDADMGSEAGRARHEDLHVRNGEARWLGPKGQRGTPRPLEKLETPLPPIDVIKKANKKDDRNYTPYEGRPCEICGKHGFLNQFAFDMHRAYHARKKEGTWKDGVSKGITKRLVPTNVGKSRFASWFEQQANGHGQEIVQVTQSVAEQVIIGSPEISAAQVVNTLKMSLAMVELAIQMQDMSPDEALRMMGAMKAMGSIPRHGRR